VILLKLAFSNFLFKFKQCQINEVNREQDGVVLVTERIFTFVEIKNLK